MSGPARPGLPKGVLLAGLLTAGVLSAGCANDAAPASSPVTTATVPGGTTGTVPVPSPTPRRTTSPTNAAEPPDRPEPQTAPPPATAGPLTARNVPSPRELGPGWRTYDDPGGSEAGFIGNGTWTRRRDPHQAAFEALPIGCANPLPSTALPIPRYALQATYRNPRGLPAQVLVLRFATAGQAASYLTGYLARMSACGTTGNLGVQPLWHEPAAAASVRRYAGAETYTELAVQRASSLALLATTTANPPADIPWTHHTTPILATTITR